MGRADLKTYTAPLNARLYRLVAEKSKLSESRNQYESTVLKVVHCFEAVKEDDMCWPNLWSE